MEKSRTFYTPCNEETNQLLEQRFYDLATSHVEHGKVLTIHHRPVTTIMCSSDIVWFEFTALCDAPRASPDYIHIASIYHTVIVSNIPVMGDDTDDKARRFIYLIDELYDRNVQLLMSSVTEPADLYTGRELAFAFRRTISRLEEMRSRKYLEKEHKM